MKKRGFTFLETLVVISIFSLIFPLALSILFVILQQQLRVFSLSEVKRQGDYIVKYLENTISNNVYTIYDSDGVEICEASNFNLFPHVSTPTSFPFLFRDRYNSEFSIIHSEPDLLINFSSPQLAPAPTFAFKQGLLNSSKVRINSFSISCVRPSAFSAPLIEIKFNICYDINNSCVSPEPQKVVSLDYQTSVKLRSFPTE